MSEDTEKFSIVLFSGTVDKIMAAVTMTAGAAAMGKKTTIFLTFWGLMGFRKGDWQKNMKFSKDFEEYAGPAMEMMQAKKVPHWMQTLQEVMEIGDVTVKACGMTMDLFDIKLEDLEPVVSEVTGVASFIKESEGGAILFV
ncbi:MAG: DsrE/DsrF/DrsH-like family protein [Chloroflexi bacterium]|uniref:DsrE/DsrF/DrsH-like family protein n=1 Tax=Candidatus Chlorohelix allophototropha TaxID=3003348 RepID=A0A8T7LYD2_9CHLR|nr:DsrE/DsrF/DrsH-like family protein [Chloroflexota bacterium]WJW67187.1 DsrE/DsrF/DrsH-like family protein [Chloroflexota bacterium L227-S17]